MKKREGMLSEARYKSQCKLINKKKELQAKYLDEAKRKYSSYERKILSYIKKKEVEYNRKCKNEIRKLEGKSEKVYLISIFTFLFVHIRCKKIYNGLLAKKRGLFFSFFNIQRSIWRLIVIIF